MGSDNSSVMKFIMKFIVASFLADLCDLANTVPHFSERNLTN